MRRLAALAAGLCLVAACGQSPDELAAEECEKIKATMDRAETRMLDAKARLDRLATTAPDDRRRAEAGRRLEQRSEAYSGAVEAHRACVAAGTPSPSPD